MFNIESEHRLTHFGVIADRIKARRNAAQSSKRSTVNSSTPISQPTIPQRINPRAAEVQQATQASKRIGQLSANAQRDLQEVEDRLAGKPRTPSSMPEILTDAQRKGLEGQRDMLKQGLATTDSNQQSAADNLANIQAGNLNQAGEKSSQDQARFDELNQNLQDVQSGAGGISGQQGFNPDGQFQTSKEQPGQFTVLDDEAFEDFLSRFSRGEGFGGQRATQSEIAQLRTQREQQKTEQMKQAQIQSELDSKERTHQGKADIPTAGGTSSVDGTSSVETNPISQRNQSQLQSILNVANSNPIFSDYIPVIQAMMNTQSSVDNEEILLQQLAGLQASDADFSGATDAVERAAQSSKELLRERTNKQDLINQRHLEIAKESAEIAKDMAKFEQQKFEINQQIRQQEQAEANIENEQRNRRIANKMGIEADTQGLKFMRDEVRKGKEALQRLSEFGDAQRGQFAIQTGRQYTQNINTALLNYDSRQAVIDANFEDSLSEIDNTVSMDAKERREKKDTIWKNYWDAKKEEDKNTADLIKDAANIMSDAIGDNLTMEFNTKKETWDNAMDYIDTFGTQNKETLNIYEGLLGLPMGSLSDQKTRDELEKKTGGTGIEGISGIENIVTQERNMINNRFPDATPEEKDNLIYTSLLSRYGDTDKGRATMRNIYSYMSANPIDGEAYTLTPSFNSTDARDNYEAQIQGVIDRQDLADEVKTPKELYDDLIAGENGMTKEEALNYLSALGYKRTDRFGSPSFD